MKADDIAVELIDLDPDNPRVPDYIGRTQADLLAYIYDRGSLSELANSFLDNGYFEAERLVVRTIGDRYTAVEGNRRLATLKILHQFPIAEGMRITDDEPSEEQLNRLRSIPCLVVGPGEGVDSYLAYRHIGGLKTWGPEAKARFIKRLVAESVENGDENIFRAVGRRVGSNAQGVRNPFLALAVLEHGREELSISTSYVQYERFGVWTRCMNSVDIRSFVSLGDPRSYDEVQAALSELDDDALAEVVADLTPRGKRKPVLQDSRDVTDYGRVLMDQRAHKVLRAHDDLEVAKQVIRQQSLPDRVARVATDVDLLMEEIYQLDEVSSDNGQAVDLQREVDRLFGAVRSMRAAVRALIDDDD